MAGPSHASPRVTASARAALPSDALDVPPGALSSEYRLASCWRTEKCSLACLLCVFRNRGTQAVGTLPRRATTLRVCHARTRSCDFRLALVASGEAETHLSGTANS